VVAHGGPDDPGSVLALRRLAIRVGVGGPRLDVCIHCEGAPCVPVCPHQALLRRPGGVIELVEPRCTGCGACVTACPHGAIRRVWTLDRAVKCDGCEGLAGGPACAPACPTGALHLVDAAARPR